jgi:hypothetical protein
VASGRLGFGDGRADGVDGRAVGVGDAVGVSFGAGLGARGSGAGADVGRGDGRGVLAGEGIAMPDKVGGAADSGAGSGEDVTRTTRNPATGTASAVAVVIKIRAGRCTVPPQVTYGPLPHSLVGIPLLRAVQTPRGAPSSREHMLRVSATIT